jgi:hypothetical protein
MEALVDLRDDLDGILGHIRSPRHIRRPVVTCRACGATGREPAPHVSVGATLAALVRFGITAKASARALERDWATYRQQHGLDLYGKRPDPKPVDPRRCAHITAS